MPAGRSTWSIRTLLAALVLLAVVPLAVVVFLFGYRSYQSERDLALGRIQEAGSDVVVGVNQFLRDSERLLRSWASDPDIASLDPGTCEHLIGVAGRLLAPEFTNLATWAGDGTPVCSVLPSPPGLRMWDAPGFAEAMAADHMYVTPVQEGRRSGLWSVVMTFPLRDEEGVRTGILAAPVDLVRFGEILDRIVQDPEVVVTVMQADGTVVSRSKEVERYVGRAFSRVLVPRVGEMIIGRAPSLDGRDFTWAYLREPTVGWVVAAGRPTEEVSGPLERVRRRMILLGFLLVSVVIWAGVLVYRAVTEPLARMVEEMAAAPPGEVPHIQVSGPREVAVTAERFNAAWAAWAAAERARARSSERFRSFVKNAVTGIFFADRQGRFLEVNRALVELMGHETEESLLATSIGALCPAEKERSGLEERMRAGKRFRGVPVTWRRKGGAHVRLRLTGRLVTQEGGEAVWECVVEDVTELTRLQEEHLQAQKMDALGRFAGGIAHDFNNLLTVLQGHVEMLRDDPQLNGDQSAQLSEMHDAIERGAALNRQLLTFGRRSARDATVLDVNGVVRDMELMIRRLVREGIEIRLALDPELGTVHMDRSQLEQVLLNLCVNARDAMPEGGTLVIRTANREEEVPDPASGQGSVTSCVELSVSDTGSGIPEDVRPRIFEPFFTTKAVGQGTGLGLSTVYGIVTQAGGHLRVESEEGHGTTMYAFLPRRADSPKGEPDPAEGAQRARSGTGVVLLVEDEGGVRRLVQRILQRAGYQVLAAPDGLEALRIVEGFPGRIDLLLTDVVMPGMSGHQVAEALAAAGKISRAVFVSGYPEGLAEERLGFLSAWAHLAKPFTGAELLDALEHVMAGRSGKAPDAGR